MLTTAQPTLFLHDAARYAHPFQVAGEVGKFRDLKVSAQRGAFLNNLHHGIV